MPELHLSAKEAQTLEVYIRHAAQKSNPKLAKLANGSAARGKTLFEKVGCKQCHTTKAKQDTALPHAKALFAVDFSKGCLAMEVNLQGSAPQFSLQAKQLESLRKFLKTDGSSLSRVVASEASQRMVANLNCNVCHRRDGEQSVLPEILLEEGEQG